jgi:hypothetical protein
MCHLHLQAKEKEELGKNGSDRRKGDPRDRNLHSHLRENISYNDL